MEGFRLFAPVVKVDAAKRLVYGVAASEAADKAGERFDYESSAPEFKKWSAEIEKGSQGKSRGNVRVMHQPIVAGILTELDCDDAQKTIAVCAKIVNDEAWQMVEAGAYTGFSIGGRYAKRWADPADPQVHRYTAIPAEISIVDNPCNPEAFFQLIKSDGRVENRPFRMGGASNTAPEASPHTRDGVRQRWIAEDGSEHVTKAAALAKNAQLAAAKAQQAMDAALKGGDAPGEGDKPYGNVEYADDGMRSDGQKRYPIDTEAHIRAAWNYIHKPKNAKLYTKEQLDEIKARIVAAWKDKIDPNGPKGDGPPEADDSKKAAAALVAKHLSDIGGVAYTILDLRRLKERLEMEAAIEGDDSPQPAKVQALIEELCQFLEALVAEETQEIIDGEEAPDFALPQIFLALPAGALKKRLSERLAKLGARHSREDQARLDLAHHAVAMARAMPGLSKDDDMHLEEAQKCLKAAGANDLHQGVITEGVATEKRHGGHKALIGEAHDLVAKLADGMTCMADKAGARHSTETMQCLKDAHDHLVAAGAECSEGASMGNPAKLSGGDLAKLESDFAALTQTVGALSERVQKGAEAIGALTAERDELKTRLAKVEAEPLPPKTLKLPPGITAVEKNAGGDAAPGDLAGELQKLSPEEIQLLLIKAARRNPMRPTFAGPETPLRS
jgi:hypothetical protein